MLEKAYIGTSIVTQNNKLKILCAYFVKNYSRCPGEEF